MEGPKQSLLQVNYFPSRFDPVRHAERFPENRMHISGTRERRMIDKVRCSSLCSDRAPISSAASFSTPAYLRSCSALCWRCRKTTSSSQETGTAASTPLARRGSSSACRRSWATRGAPRYIRPPTAISSISDFFQLRLSILEA